MAARKRQTTYYQTQRGYGGMRVFRAQPMQRGHGIGGLFKGLMRVAMPLLKKGLLFAGKRALTAGANVLQDVSENKSSLKEAAKNRALEAINPLNLINSAPRKRKSNTSVTQRKRKVKRTANTIGKRASRTTGKLVAPSL